MLEFKAILIDIMRRFEVESVVSKIDLENYLTLRPRGGLRIRFRRVGDGEGKETDSETSLADTLTGHKMGRNRKTSAWLG